MTVHCIEIWTDTNITSGKSEEDLIQQIEDYIAAEGEFSDTGNSGFSSEQEYANDSMTVEFEYYRALIRLQAGNDFENKKSKIKTDMENFLNNNFNIWQWRYHECHADEPNPQDCVWTAKNHSNVNDIPDDVEF